MNLFRETKWKWWEMKFIAWGGLLFGLVIGTYFNEYLVDWLWLVWIGFAIIWLYVMVAWFKK